MAYLIINGLSQPGGVVTAFVSTRLPLERHTGTRFVFCFAAPPASCLRARQRTLSGNRG